MIKEKSALRAVRLRRFLAALAGIAIVVAGSEIKRAVEQSMATLVKPATIPIAAPPQAKSGIFLVVSVRAYTPPRRGAIEAVVTLATGRGIEQDVGGFSIFPNEPFAVADARQERAFRLDATAALAALKSKGDTLLVSVRLASAGPSITSDAASLSVGRVSFYPRP